MAYKYRTSFTAAAQADREEPIVDGRFSSDGTQYIADLEKINIGTGNDLQIYHDSNSYIKDAGDGYLQVSTNGSGVYFVKSDGSSLASFIADGSCELFEAGQLKLETTAAGVKMPSSTYFQFDAASSNAWAIGATTGADLPAGEGIALQYHHWNNAAWDKVSFKTRDGVGVPNDKKFMAGDSSDLEIYHESSGSNGMIFNKTGDLYIQGNNGSGAAQTAIQIHSNEGVDLKFAGLGPKLSTLTNGVAITGEAIITQSGATGGGYFNLAVKNTNASNDYSLIYFQSTDTGSSTSSAAAIRSNFAADDSSANGRLEIRTRNSGTLTTALTLNETQNATFAGDVKIHKSGDASLNIRDTSANAVSNWIEVDSSDGLAIYNCYKEGVGTAYPHVFKGYTTEYGRFDAGGIKLPATKGIQFSTYGEDDSNAATTVTGNTLSDYEEGTWTPQFSNGFGAAAQTHGTDGALAVGSYTKVGNLVNVSFILRLADDTGGAHPSTTNGQRINISGLPFTSSSTSYHYGAGSTAYHHFVGTSNATASASILVGTQTTVLDFYQGNTSFVGGDGSDQKSKTLYGMATYHTTS